MEEWLPEAVGCGEDEAFSEAVAAELRPAALAEFEAAQAAVFLAGAEVYIFSCGSNERALTVCKDDRHCAVQRHVKTQKV